MKRGILASSPAAADVTHMFGTTPRAMSLGGAYTAVADDAAALYYNPAGLAAVEGTYVALAFIFTAPNLFATGPADNPLALGPPSDEGYGLHLAWSPRELLDGRLGIGFSTLLPHRRALGFQIHKIEDPYFVLYENSVELLEIRLGMAYRVLDFLSVGVSALLLAGLDGTVEIEAPFQSDPIDESRRTVVALQTVLPNREFVAAGMQLYPFDGLTVGLSWRQASFIEVKLPIDFTVMIFGIDLPTTAGLDVKAKFAPHQFNLGIAYEPNDEWLISTDLSFAMYADYEMPSANVDIDVSRLGEGIVILPPERLKNDLRNVWVPRIGVEWRPLQGLALRGGYYYMRSFIRGSAQPILDSDKHSLTVGAGYVLDRVLFDSDSAHLALLAAGQLLVYTGRRTAGILHYGQVMSTTFGAEFRY